MKNLKIYFAVSIMVLTVIFCLASCGEKDVDTYTETIGETESVSAEFSDTASPDTHSPDTDINPYEIILPSEDDFSNPDFVIEKGVLVKYLGEGESIFYRKMDGK